jgi:hypothetical protein
VDNGDVRNLTEGIGRTPWEPRVKTFPCRYCGKVNEARSYCPTGHEEQAALDMLKAAKGDA